MPGKQNTLNTHLLMMEQTQQVDVDNRMVFIQL